MSRFLSRLCKAARVVATGKRHIISPMFSGTAASVEHFVVLQSLPEPAASVVDIGANRGQFALAVRHVFPNSTIHSFEPLDRPAGLYRQLLKPEAGFHLTQAAIGPEDKQVTIHVSACDDSSSLLPIAPLQSVLFPGTQETHTETIRQAPLDAFLDMPSLPRPCLLKLDVQVL